MTSRQSIPTTGQASQRQQPATATLTDPVRYPASASAPVRSKRAFVLLLMTLLLPGSAQVVAGDRKLGRTALRVTFTVWALALLLLVLALVNRSLVLGLFTHPVLSLLLIVVLLALAAGWVLLFINTFRIIRPVLLAPGMRPIVAVALVLSMVIGSGTLSYFAYVLNVGRNAIGSIFANGPALEPVDGRYNFLMMGGDAGDGRTGRRPDSLSVISVDAETGASAIISVPRNLQNAQFSEGSPMREVYPEGYNCGNECLINAINTEVTNNYANLYPGVSDPGAQATMEAVSGSLGITIQAYVVVDMDGFSKLIDAMGGIRIKSGAWVPISGGMLPGSDTRHVKPDGWIPPGEQKLNGFQAQWYARSRENVDDFARIARQQCVQQAMLKQLDPATLLSKFEAIANAGTKVVESNISAAQLGSFVDLAIKSKNQPVSRLTIGPPDFEGWFSTTPDFNVIHERVRKLLAPKASPKAGAAFSGAVQEDPASGVVLSVPGSGPQAGGLPTRVSAETPAGDFTPVTTRPDGQPITAAYLNSLYDIQDYATLELLLANNGQCRPL
ncbi:transcriptional regulator [Arthrobacter sp. SW1]|uniref:LCP family protein n=1 Tax=Arthrobacter sp. SW1 TaxID=1920889 RepID=UPI000877E1F6|nr:LCP family protein [Arthrobacter sp. SW1]OFI37785.1 transcriptional regulator [Arthrobacter sp. SW1]